MHLFRLLRLSGALACLGLLATHGAESSPADLDVTNILQVQNAGALDFPVNCQIHLEGDVWWANPAEGRLVLQDATGIAELELDLNGQPVSAGKRIRLDGNGTITKIGAGFRIGVIGPVVDNNGVHEMVEKSGAVYLKAGRQPIRLDWFNGIDKSGLMVEYAGPDLPRRKIPDTALFLTQTNPANGLNYRAYNVAGEILPDFNQLPASKAGTVANFDLNVRTGVEHVGLEFSSFLEVPRDGLYTFFITSDDGSQLFVGKPDLHLAALGDVAFPAPRVIVPGQLLGGEDKFQWAQVEGPVTFVGIKTNSMNLEMSSGTSRLLVTVADHSGLSRELLLNHRIRATGVCQSTYTSDGQKVAGAMLVTGSNNIQLLESNRESAVIASGVAGALPLLTTAVEVHELSREEAQRGYPVKIQGVVTCILPERHAFIIQDTTRGLYVVDQSEQRAFLPQIGEFLEVQGTTDPSLFAPIVNIHQWRPLGAGRLPEPLDPSWDQLINGSLDAQYVEIQGVLTTVNTNEVTLLTRYGRIKMELRLTSQLPETLEHYVDALVRVRGCFLASWDYVTHEVTVGEARIYGAEISMDQPPPADLFAIPKKTAAELLLFDPQAGVFHRVRVNGQIVHRQGSEYWMMDGKNGLRFITKGPIQFETGDFVEVVGFPELSGPSPLLREAVARKTGHAPLPPANVLSATNLLQANYDATLVRLQGVLVNIRNTPSEQVFEIQNGVRTFIARLAGSHTSLDNLPVGSQVALTGVYSAQGVNRVEAQDISSFELLLNSPTDITVLARPPWWTLTRLLIILGAMACVLTITVLWITLLHRKVEQRTVELAAQIQERQRVEHLRAMEQERARVAQDLHDELGSGLTEISMLVTVAGSGTVTTNGAGPHLGQIGDRARQMVTALDEIVWAMNPKHDSLASLVSYSCLYADQFLKLANIDCRLKGGVGFPDRRINAAYRHEFFLAFKEALNNVVRHSGATEVCLGVKLIGNRLRFSIADNGGGLRFGVSKEGSDGLGNMRLRLEKMGGRFEIASQAGRGTTLRFYLPLN